MSQQKPNKQAEKIKTWFFVILAIAFLITLFLIRGQLNDYVSTSIKATSNTDETISSQRLIDSLYNYTENGKLFETTFLEFGAKNCVACRKMEYVMSEVEQSYTDQVYVVFLNILKPQNQALMKYYGVSAIPTQILLNEEGKEYFRHTGYISFADLRKNFMITSN